LIENTFNWTLTVLGSGADFLNQSFDHKNHFC